MGQKVNPLGIRLGITRDWTSKWYADRKQYPLLVFTDYRVRKFLHSKLAEASVSRILIERAAKKVNITIQTARPGIVIGKKGEDIEKLRQATAKLLSMNINDVRLNVAEIARTEWSREGRVPLHTFRADIDYGLAEAHTTYGVIGVKVWIFKGEVFEAARPEVAAEVAPDVAAPAPPASPDQPPAA